ncbi:sulfite exporter TauE/SafE [Fragilaria crotonensis]|nr:sulfite exporter TauE/SafE [Fragilaria crotonensis]
MDMSMRLLEVVFADDHAPLFPLSASDYVGFAFATIGLLIAAGGGIGGGGILVPIFILVMRFSPKHAIPLSNITVFGGAVANTLLNKSKRHPLADRPLVDWDLIMIMEPVTMAGALIGSSLNKVLDEYVLVAVLAILLSAIAFETLGKAIRLYVAETKIQFALEHGSSITEGETASAVGVECTAEGETLPLLDHHKVQYNETFNHGESLTVRAPVVDDELHRILEEEKVTPVGSVRLLVMMFVVVLLINILKGGGAFKSPIGISCGSASFWTANFIMLAWIVVISIKARSNLVNRFDLKRRLGYRYVAGDIQWSASATLVYPILCCFAGFFAGMFGIGGGIVKGPLMLAMGVHPAVVSATSATMILFTSSTSTTSYIVFGLLRMDYGIVCLSVGFLATYAGQICLAAVMKRFKRNSLIAFSIGFVVLASAVLMTVQSVLTLKKGVNHEPGGICSNEV